MNLVCKHALALLLLCLALTACQYRGEVVERGEVGAWRSDGDFFAQAQTRLAGLPLWRYSAKVGLTTAKLKEQASLVWQYQDQSNDVRLFGPMGVGALKLEFDRYGVQLSDSKGALYQGQSAQALLTEIVGWPLPIDALSYWLFVIPAPGHTYQYRLDENGQVASLRQLGWQIDFDRYRLYSEQLLPGKLTAFKRFDSEQHGDVQVKLITKSWEW